MVTGNRSTTGHPILVGGPQISHFFPGLVLEIDMHAPHLHWRGATSAPVPGLPADRPHAPLLHHAHLGERRHHRPVRRDALRRQHREVHVQGQVPDDGPLQRRDPDGNPVSFLTTVHGPVVGYARVRGRTSRSPRSARAAARTSSTSSSSAGSPTARSRTRRASSRRPRSPRRPSTPSTSTPSTSPSTRAGACRSATRRRSRAADQGVRAVRVARLPEADGPHRTAWTTSRAS